MKMFLLITVFSAILGGLDVLESTQKSANKSKRKNKTIAIIKSAVQIGTMGVVIGFQMF